MNFNNFFVEKIAKIRSDLDDQYEIFEKEEKSNFDEFEYPRNQVEDLFEIKPVSVETVVSLMKSQLSQRNNLY